MATIVFSLSSVEGLQRFRDLAESLLEMHDGGVSGNLLEKLAEKAESLGVHRADVQGILLEIVRDKSPLGNMLIQADAESPENIQLKCPRCDALFQSLETDCPYCHWSFTFCFGGVPDEVLQRTLKEIEIARKVWSDRERVRLIHSFYTYKGVKLPEEHQIVIKWFEQDADMGFMYAQFNLGRAYRYGARGICVDKQKAFHWIKKSAEQGLADAENDVGEMLTYGEGCEKDSAEGVVWYGKAAAKGLAEAQYHLGCSYKEGAGVTNDDYEALKWFLKAADQGYSAAKNQIGLLFHEGRGVEKNFQQASQWFANAALDDYAVAQRNLGFSFKHGYGVGKNLFVARSLCKLAANNGYKKAEEEFVDSIVKAPWKLKNPARVREIGLYQDAIKEIASLLMGIARFDLDHETILDKKEGLIWLRTVTPIKETWGGAITLIDDINANKCAGFGDWRLPEKHEWLSMLNLASNLGVERYFNLFLDGLGFDLIKPGLYWSSTGDDGSSYCANLKFGGISMHNDNEKAYVLVVRG